MRRILPLELIDAIAGLADLARVSRCQIDDPQPLEIAFAVGDLRRIRIRIGLFREIGNRAAIGRPMKRGDAGLLLCESRGVAPVCWSGIDLRSSAAIGEESECLSVRSPLRRLFVLFRWCDLANGAARNVQDADARGPVLRIAQRDIGQLGSVRGKMEIAHAFVGERFCRRQRGFRPRRGRNQGKQRRSEEACCVALHVGHPCVLLR